MTFYDRICLMVKIFKFTFYFGKKSNVSLSIDLWKSPRTSGKKMSLLLTFFVYFIRSNEHNISMEGNADGNHQRLLVEN